LLTLNNERISVPEVLFHPSDIGLNQAGISESVVQSVESLESPIEKSVMYDTILLVGGNSLFKNCLSFLFLKIDKQRMEDEIRSLVPDKYNVTVHSVQE
jgi:actin-related protein 6